MLDSELLTEMNKYKIPLFEKRVVYYFPRYLLDSTTVIDKINEMRSIYGEIWLSGEDSEIRIYANVHLSEFEIRAKIKEAKYIENSRKERETYRINEAINFLKLSGYKVENEN